MDSSAKVQCVHGASRGIGREFSKAAQNMTLSIELGRLASETIVVGLHPGTVDTNLSKPFQRNVSGDKLLTPERAVSSLLDVINGLQKEDSGRVFDFRGEEIPP